MPAPATPVRDLPANWLRADAFVAALLGLSGALLVWLASLSFGLSFSTPLVVQLFGAMLIAVPLVWRRRFPLSSGVALLVVFIAAGLVFGMDSVASKVVVFLSFYSIGAWSSDRRRAGILRAVISTLIIAMSVISTTMGIIASESLNLGAMIVANVMNQLVNVAFFVVAWVFGDKAWQQGLDQQALRESYARIEGLQEQLVQQALTDERLRIARELHDVVAHHVTAMSVQAAAARRLLAKDPDNASSHLRQIESSARSAVEDMRTMLVMLRGSQEQEGISSLADLPALVEADEHASLTVVGEPSELPATRSLSMYRVAQEALTNVRKHAGAGAKASVVVRYLPDLVELEISDDGRSTGSSLPGAGVGLIGMRERMEAVGGTLEAGPKPRGGFRVRAQVPRSTA